MSNTCLQVDIFINKEKYSINEVNNNSLVISLLLFCLKINQEILVNKNKQKFSKKVCKKKDLRPIMGLLNDNIILKKLILARKLL